MHDEKKFLSSWHSSTVVVKPTHPQLVLYKAVFVRGIIEFVTNSWTDDDTHQPGEGVTTMERHWVPDEDATEYDAGSFPWYCHRLGLNPTVARKRLSDPQHLDHIRKLAAKAIKIFRKDPERELDERTKKLLQAGKTPAITKTIIEREFDEKVDDIENKIVEALKGGRHGLTSPEPTVDGGKNRGDRPGEQDNGLGDSGTKKRRVGSARKRELLPVWEK